MRTAHCNTKLANCKCGHPGCTQKFKSRKQKLSHHDKLEPECAKEKALLTTLAGGFQNIINNLLNNFCVNIKDSQEYMELTEQINNCSNNVMNKEYFEMIFKK
jgi:hypothetical protein